MPHSLERNQFWKLSDLKMIELKGRGAKSPLKSHVVLQQYKKWQSNMSVNLKAPEKGVHNTGYRMRKFAKIVIDDELLEFYEIRE